MSRNDKMDAFVREGLSRYPGARDAVSEFESQVQDCLAKAFEGKTDWRNFKPRRGGRGRGKAILTGTWTDDAGGGIYAHQLAAKDADGWLDLGVCWRPLRGRDGVLLCCGLSLPGERVRSVKLDNPTDPVECGVVGDEDGDNAQLFVLLDGEREPDIGRLARLLLDEMDRALGSAASTDPESKAQP